MIRQTVGLCKLCLCVLGLFGRLHSIGYVLLVRRDDYALIAWTDRQTPVVVNSEQKFSKSMISAQITVHFRKSLLPAHYTLKVESFSRISKIFPWNKEAKYESNVFESGGYKWRLDFYPNGRNIWNGKGNISLYLVIAETDSLPLGWEVNAIFRLFVFDQIRDKYLTFQDANGKGKLFHAMNTEWGLPNFLTSRMFSDPCNGYLVDDSCVFGTEVFVIKCAGKGELLSILSSPVTINCTWEISHLSVLKVEYLSKEFKVGEGKWELKLYPKAYSDDDGKSCVKLFLSFCDWETHPHRAKLYAKYALHVRLHETHHDIMKDLSFYRDYEEVIDYNWFSALDGEHVCLKLMPRPLTTGESFVVEAKIEIISVVMDFSEKKVKAKMIIFVVELATLLVHQVSTN